jgi:type I restriction enzyme S subunit
MPQNKNPKPKTAADSSTANQKPNSPLTKPGFKLTKLGWIPEEWEYDTLRNAADYVDYRGKTPVKSDSGIFLVTAKNIKDGFIDYQHSKEYIPVDTFDDVMSRGQVQLGDVVITTEAPLGKVAQIDKEGIALAQRVIKYRGKSKVLDNNYFRHFLMGHTFQAELLKESTGSTVLGIKGSRLHKIKIAIPSLPEQTRIAACLTTWDRAITTTRKLLQQLDERKKGLMQGLLTGAVRVPGFEDAWRFTKLGNILNYEQPTKYRVESKDYSDEYKTPVLTPGKTFLLGYTNETEGIYQDNLPIILFDDFTTASKFVDFPFKVKSSAVKFLTLHNDNYDINFIYSAMQVLKFIPDSHKRYWISEFSEMDIKVPSLSEQKAIAKILTTADQEIALYKRKLAKLEAQKKGLMQQLLTGQKRLQA